LPAKIIDGRKIAAEIRGGLKSRADKLKERGIIPGLAILLVGEHPGSLSYLREIERGCDELGMYTESVKLARSVTQEELEKKIEEVNQDNKFHGVIIQLPLPERLDAVKAGSAISPRKDVDGANPVNMGRLLLGEEAFVPSTAYGVHQLLIHSGNSPEGKHVVICGRSNIVGKPLMGILVQKRKDANATVTVCHTGTKNLSSITNQADILIVAIGRAEFITADMIKEGAIIIDVGVNQVEIPAGSGKFKLAGDVNFDAVKEKAGAITPVPGGVGPVTTAMLLTNVIKAAEALAGGIALRSLQ
jgi:methylenetetrahydrofolate dehydrogenase (NADP+)/methenyltetrahydrofolate cyclohydrolase